MAKQRVLHVKFDEDDEFDYIETRSRIGNDLSAALARQLAHLLQLMKAEGYAKHRDLYSVETRLRRAFRPSADEICFRHRFEPYREWLAENAIPEADDHGRFFGTRSYRLKNCDVHRGFTITFGTVKDAIHFKLRFGGTCQK